MGPEIGTGKKSKAKVEASTYKAFASIDKELEDEFMKYTTNYEGNKSGTRLDDQTEKVNVNANVEVNIMECTTSGGNEIIKAGARLVEQTEKVDVNANVEVNVMECTTSGGNEIIETESSSSFDGSDCEVAGTSGDFAALSDILGDAGPPFDLYDFDAKVSIKEKKLTAHWRYYIQPLKWRCKWVELQMMKFEALAQRYDKELEKYNQQKKVRLENSKLEGLGVKSIPFSPNYVRSEVLRRKRRRRDEATENPSANMSRHNLFSYYENKERFTKSAFMVGESKNFAPQQLYIGDELWSMDRLLLLENENCDYHAEDLFRKIELLRSQVGKMKSRLEKATSRNVGILSSTDKSSLPVPDSAPVSSPRDYRNTMTFGDYVASQLTPKYNKDNVLVPEKPVRCRGDVAPDANRNKVRAYSAYASGNGDDDGLIDNHVAMELMNNSEETKTQSTQTPLVFEVGLSSANPLVPAKRKPPRPPQRPHSNSNRAALESKSKNGRRKDASW